MSSNVAVAVRSCSSKKKRIIIIIYIYKYNIIIIPETKVPTYAPTMPPALPDYNMTTPLRLSHTRAHHPDLRDRTHEEEGEGEESG